MSSSPPMEVAVAVHDSKLREFDRWKDKHEREDDENHAKIGTDVSKCLTGIDRLNVTLEPIIKAYWGEDSSKLTNTLEERKKRTSSRVSPEVRQGGTIAALVTVVMVLAEVIKAVLHQAPPPPPSTAQIAAEVAKALQKPEAPK